MPVTPDPLPFRLSLAGEETLDTRGIRSVSYKVQGLLHLEDDTLALEWAVDQYTESVGLGGVSTGAEKFDYEELVVPLTWLTEVRLTRFPSRRLKLRARRLDAFDGVPSARPGSVSLRIRHRDRHLAAAMVEAIDDARASILSDPDYELLVDGDTPTGDAS